MTQVFHSEVNNVVPWQANYSFPSQTTKSEKTMVKLAAKNGKDPFTATDTLRFEFPSDQYLNMLNSQISFDVRITESKPSKLSVQIVKSGGATPVYTLHTSVPNYNVQDYYKGYYLQFDLDGFENQQVMIMSQSNAGVITISNSILKTPILVDQTTTALLRSGTRFQDGGAHALFSRIKITYGGMVLEDIVDYNVIARMLVDCGVARPYLHGSGAILEGTSATYLEDEKFWRILSPTALVNSGETQAMQHTTLINSGSWKRMCFRPFLGLMNCKKLIPLKWMASSLVIEMTLARDEDVIIAPLAASTAPKIELRRPFFMAELINFDSTYDAGFYYGLQQFGVPLKFSTWNTYVHNPSGTNEQIQIHERARSIKLALAGVRDSNRRFQVDSNRFYHAVSSQIVPNADLVTQPACLGSDGNAITSTTRGQITEYQWRIGGRYWPAQPVDCTNGGAEAYVELLKTMDAVGDYTFANNVDPRDWHTDYDLYGGNKFVISGHFEMTDVNPDTISGINGEEQSDIMLNVKTDDVFKNKSMSIFVAHDALLLIKPENSVELVY
jgi:hypothetical protein